MDTFLTDRMQKKPPVKIPSNWSAPDTSGTKILDKPNVAIDSTVVHNTGNETVNGIKTFNDTIVGAINGNAGSVTNGVYTVGNQSIAGTKTFTDTLTVTSGMVGHITNATDTYQILTTDYTVACNKATAFTVTLPVAVVGQEFEVTNKGTGLVTIDGYSTDTICGELTQSLYQYETLHLRCIANNTWSAV